MNWLEYHEEPVTLHSGGKSHWLVRADLIFADEYLRREVLDYWAVVLKGWSPPFDIVSIPTGGDVWAEALKERVGNFVRGAATTYRVLVDDVVTTGKSMLDLNSHIRLAVVDRRSFYNYGSLDIKSWMKINLPLL